MTTPGTLTRPRNGNPGIVPPWLLKPNQAPLRPFPPVPTPEPVERPVDGPTETKPNG